MYLKRNQLRNFHKNHVKKKKEVGKQEVIVPDVQNQIQQYGSTL